MPGKADMEFDFDALTAQANQLSGKSSHEYDGTSSRSTHHENRANHPHRRGKPKIITGRPKGLCLPHLCGIENIASALIVRQECLWDTYRRVIACDIAGSVVLASRYSRPSRLVAIRRYPKQDAHHLIERFGRLNHSNILSVQECYIYADILYALVDDLPLALVHMISCPNIYPTERELASLMAQILDGISYLSACRLAHPTFACSDILLDMNGVVKIGCLEACVNCTSDQAETTYAAMLSSITMQLMQKYNKSENSVGIDNLRRWPADSNAVGFLSATAARESLGSLKKHPLITSIHFPPAALVTLARSVMLSGQVTHTIFE